MKKVKCLIVINFSFLTLGFSQDSRPFHVQLSENKQIIESKDLFSLQSDPSSKNVIFLDFQSPNMKDSSFVVNEFIEISEDYYLFNVNVTTDKDVYTNTPLENKIRMQYNENAPIDPSRAGECHMDCFGDQKGQDNCWTRSYLGNATGTHELGHGLGLKHDYSYESPTYEKGSANFRPIMGSGTTSAGSGPDMKFRGFWNLTPSVLGRQDDFKIIARHLGKRQAQADSSLDLATTIQVEKDGSILPKSNWSFITYNKWEHPDFGDSKDTVYTDVDYWKFSTNGGILQIQITPTFEYNNLHLIATLYDQKGNEVIAGTPLDNNHVVKQASSFEVEIGSGDYYIKVEPSGLKDNENGKGYPVYSSVGFYQFSGTINGGFTDIKTPFVTNTTPINHNSRATVFSINGQFYGSLADSDELNIEQITEKLQLSPGIYYLKSKAKRFKFEVTH